MSARRPPRLRSAAARSGDGDDPLVMVTAYDAPGARMADDAGIDMILVGDSPGHGRARLRRHPAGDRRRHGPPHRGGRPGQALGRSSSPTCRGSATTCRSRTPSATPPQLIRAGAQAVKLEGGRKRLPMIEAIIDAEIPVMGHIGLTPQSVHAMGGFKVQGRKHDAALALVDDAKALAARRLLRHRARGRARRGRPHGHRGHRHPHHRHRRRPGTATARCSCSTTCSASRTASPRSSCAATPPSRPTARRALGAYADDVRTGPFPNADESYHLADDEADALGLYGRRRSRPPELCCFDLLSQVRLRRSGSRRGAYRPRRCGGQEC